jgi:hypothetical protein
MLERRLTCMEEQFRIFQESLKPKSKGKGRGKRSNRTETEFADEVAKEAQKRLRSFLQSSEPSTSTSFESFPLPSAPPLETWTEDNTSFRGSSVHVCPSIEPEATKKVFITNITVTLNGTPLDQVADKQNEEECMQAYWRLFTFNGQMNSLFTNGIRDGLINTLLLIIEFY